MRSDLVTDAADELMRDYKHQDLGSFDGLSDVRNGDLLKQQRGIVGHLQTVEVNDSCLMIQRRLRETLPVSHIRTHSLRVAPHRVLSRTQRHVGGQS